jgi:hypothetical protein
MQVCCNRALSGLRAFPTKEWLMTTLSRGAGAASVSSSAAVRNLTVALIALLIATVVVLTLALASTGDGSDGQGRTIQVAPSAVPPSPAERGQIQALNGPGMRP